MGEGEDMECTSYTTYRLLPIDEVMANLGMNEEERTNVVEKYCVIDFNFLIGFDPIVIADYDALYSGQFAWPISGHHSISSPYGMRKHPVHGGHTMHYGIDIPAPAGTPITTPAEGRILDISWSDAVGWTITIDHGKDPDTEQRITSRYLHCTKISGIRKGQIVAEGKILALVGDERDMGYLSTGPHLHFEVLVDGVNQDPAKFFAKR